jgi:hypothetical protein
MGSDKRLLHHRSVQGDVPVSSGVNALAHAPSCCSLLRTGVGGNGWKAAAGFEKSMFVNQCSNRTAFGVMH